MVWIHKKNHFGLKFWKAGMKVKIEYISLLPKYCVITLEQYVLTNSHLKL